MAREFYTDWQCKALNVSYLKFPFEAMCGNCGKPWGQHSGALCPTENSAFGKFVEYGQAHCPTCSCFAIPGRQYTDRGQGPDQI